MKTSSFKIYLLNKIIQKQKFYILPIALFLAIFCLPQFSSFAYFHLDPQAFTEHVRQFVQVNSREDSKIMKLYVTAYTSTRAETDATPCIAASGYDLCKHDVENVVACNFLPFGTKIKFPDIYPDRVFTVVDRMHERYNSRIDIWMNDRQAAKQFGVKYLKVEILH